MSAGAKARLCVIAKADGGYGFHLHGEKGKSGQYIRKVEAGSPAEASGLRAGDRVLEVNGENVEKETHHQVVHRIRAVEHETRLLVVDHEADELLRCLRLSSRDEGKPNVPDKAENGTVILQSVTATHDQPEPETSSSRWPDKSPPQEYCPRLCHMVMEEMGYGFNLHSEKARPGQYIRSVDPGSSAERAGLQTKDRLIEVNGINIEKLKHTEVVAFIKKGGSETQLLVVDPDTDEHFKKLGITPTESHIKDFPTSTVTNGSRKFRTHGSVASQSSQSTSSELSSSDTPIQPEDDKRCLLDPFVETGLRLSPTAAEAKEKVRAKRAKKRAPQMDWSKKYEIFSNF